MYKKVLSIGLLYCVTACLGMQSPAPTYEPSMYETTALMNTDKAAPAVRSYVSAAQTPTKASNPYHDPVGACCFACGRGAETCCDACCETCGRCINPCCKCSNEACSCLGENCCYCCWRIFPIGFNGWKFSFRNSRKNY